MSDAGGRTLWRSARPAFLVLTPVSVFLGCCSALARGATIDPTVLALVLLGAAGAHVGVNALNEYLDYRSGLDARTRKTPFSGGSGALVENPSAAGAVLVLAFAALAVTLAVGVYFVYRIGIAVLPLGLVGILLILTYTTWLNRQPLLCLVAPGLGFGPLMVVGTDLVLTGTWHGLPWFVAAVPFVLANNLLLLNQFPDIDADRSVGRRHIAIAYGPRRAAFVYVAGVAVLAATLVGGVLAAWVPVTTLVALVPLVATVPIGRMALRFDGDTARLLPYLGRNVVVTLATPVVFGIGMLVG